MNRINQAWRMGVWMVWFFALAASCSAIPRLQATYRLPVEEGALAGKKAFVSVEDLREDKRTLGEVAALKFVDSGGVISLSVAKRSGPGVIKGIFQPPALLKEALENRMKHEGIHVIREGAATTGLSVLLKSFFLDRVARNWKAAISYEARLMRDGEVVSSQLVSGEAERFDLIGVSNADVALSELLTDAVNRLDLSELFRTSEP